MSIERSIFPLRDLPAGRLDARKTHLVTEILLAPQRPHRGALIREATPRRRVTALAILVGLLVIGTAVASRTSWLSGSPAPDSVVADFGSYAPQLGFDPEPDRAVLVAEDGDVSLYATTNRQGSYCLVASAPWKRPETLRDGGTCIAASQAAAPLVAGLVGASSSRDGDLQTYVIAGRTADPQARTIRFNGPNGTWITRRVGSSGFFVATVHTTGAACAAGDWDATFSIHGADGEERARSTIRLASAPSGLPGVCVFGAPHA